jgi:AraC-like DNA-binding protein
MLFMRTFNYYTIPPPPHLARYVRSFWIYEGLVYQGSASEDLAYHGSANKGFAYNGSAYDANIYKRDDFYIDPYIYRSMADPCAEMVFHYKGLWQDVDENNTIITGTETTSTLQAPTGRYKRFVTAGGFGIFGVYFYPYAIPELFKLSSGELQGDMPTVAHVLGAEGRLLEERVLSAGNNHQRVNLLIEWLTAKVQKIFTSATPIQHCIRHMIHTCDSPRVEDLATGYNISARQLERKFKTITGLTPKSFLRISRFQHALKQYGGNYRSLKDIAYDCGYYDQSHFIHDFKEFSGYEPRNYFAGKAEGIEYREC